MPADARDAHSYAAAVRRCALAALLLVAGAFPDVIFFDASVSLVNWVNITIEPRASKVQVFPERNGRQVHHGYYDAGGAAFQSEPGAQFMARALRDGQSIWWNPYSAAGSFGPETLVDIKTSPLSMTVALFGGSDLAFHLAFLGFCTLGVFCLLLLLHAELRLSMLAAVAGGVTYLLNGYHVANLASNVSQTWLYFPVLALGLVSYANRPRVLPFLGITAAAVLILSTTFLPTTLMILGTTLFVGAAAALGVSLADKTGGRLALLAAGRLVGGQALAVLLALLILAVLYLPVIEVLRYMATGDTYGKRVFHPASLMNFISLFTPKHAFEEYNAIGPRAIELRGNVAFHQGIIGALLAAQALRAWPPLQRTLLLAIGAPLVLLIARVYGLPGITGIANITPVLGSLGEQYLWAGIGILFTLSVPFGVQALSEGGVRRWPLYAGAAVILGALAWVAHVHGVQGRLAQLHVWLMGLIVGTAVYLMLKADRRPPRKRWVVVLLVALSWLELTFYVNHYRLARTDRFAEPPRFVRFLQQQGGLHRVASYGPWGMPPEYGSAYGIYQIDSLNFHLNTRYEAIFNRLILPDPKERWFTFISLNLARDKDGINLAAYDLLGTRFLIVPVAFPRMRAFMERSGWARAYADAYFIIFENPDPLPRAFITHRLAERETTPVDSGESPREVATSDDPQFLDSARRIGITEKASNGRLKEELAVIKRYEHVRVDIEADLAQPGVLVLTDAWHPNWAVTVDGSPSRIGVVDGAFRGVALPAGKHLVEMTYAPRTLFAGKLLSALGILLALLLFAMRRRIDPLLAAGKDIPSPESIAIETDSKGLPSFCIALPVYNEATGIERCIDGIARFLDPVDTRTAIIAVDDGSRDGSLDIMQRMQQRLPRLIVHRHERNQGYGAANRTLCRLAAEHGFDYAIVMDADGTQDPRYIANFFPLLRQGVDFVKATRYRLGGGVNGVPWQRYLISYFGNRLARAVMRIPLSDFSNGFRAIRTTKWRQLESTENAFVLLIEECYLARKLGLSFGEVPYILTVRRDPDSESKFSYRWDVYFNYLKYVFKR